jgi:hypothetical protein
MSTRLFRPIAATLIVLLFCGTSIQAGPVSIREVVVILDKFQNPSKVDLIYVTNSTNRATTVPRTNNPGDSNRSAEVVNVDDTQGTVSVINQGDFEGTICDCGEIILPAGGFPKWPLVFLGAIPFFFIPHGEEKVPPTILPVGVPFSSTPLPTPTVPQVPEPSSLLLLISGLAALGIGWQRRRFIANRILEKTGAKANG